MLDLENRQLNIKHFTLEKKPTEKQLFNFDELVSESKWNEINRYIDNPMHDSLDENADLLAQAKLSLISKRSLNLKSEGIKKLSQSTKEFDSNRRTIIPHFSEYYPSLKLISITLDPEHQPILDPKMWDMMVLAANERSHKAIFAPTDITHPQKLGELLSVLRVCYPDFYNDKNWLAGKADTINNAVRNERNPHYKVQLHASLKMIHPNFKTDLPDSEMKELIESFKRFVNAEGIYFEKPKSIVDFGYALHILSAKRLVINNGRFHFEQEPPTKFNTSTPTLPEMRNF